MAKDSPRVRALMRQANKTEDVGKKQAAEQLYRQILDEAPDTTAAWLGLARVANDPGVQHEAYQRALELEPGNEAALAALNPVKKDAAPEVPSAPISNAGAPAIGAPAAVTLPEEYVAPAVIAPAEAEIVPEEADEGEILYVCYRHPETETNLRCYNCSRPICMKCANRTPVGYMCPICIHEAQEVFFSANIVDYLAAAAVALILGLIGGFIARFIGFFVIFVAAGGGALIGRLSFRAARRHRGRYLPHVVALMVIVGAIIPSLGSLLFVLVNPGSLLALLWPAVYLFLAPAAAFWQVK